jgi:YfiH family protein
MEFLKASIPAGARDGVAIAFPGPAAAAGGEAIAFLSLESQGDMKYGDPARAADRERFLRGYGVDPRDTRGLALAHSRNVVFPSRDDDVAALSREAGGADGLILIDPGLVATVTVADCMPIWLLDRGSGAFGILHSGWRGTGILARAVEAMAYRFRTRPSSLAVILGPAIGSCCYAVPEARAETFAAEFGDAAVERRGGAFYLDLRSANVDLARRAGVGRLLSIEACTSCDGRLGSYRRQGAGFTRMIAACGRSPRAPDIPGAGSGA